MKCLFLAVTLIMLAGETVAQEDQIDPERPNKTQTAAAVGKHVLQVEAGFRMEKTSADSRTVDEPQLLIRYGVLKSLELRVDAEVTRITNELSGDHKTATGLQPLTVGFKTEVCAGGKVFPKTALIAEVAIPTLASEEFKGVHAAPQITLAMSNELTKGIKFGYNVGAEWDGIEKSPAWIYSFSPNFDITDRWQAFVEVFGEVKKNGSPKHTVDGGIMFLITDNFTADIFYARGISSSAPQCCFGFGSAFRFK